MANLGDLLDLFGGSNLKSLIFVGDVVGVMADLAGAGEAIGAVIAVVDDFLGSSGKTGKNAQAETLLADIKGALQNLMDAIDQTNGRGRWTDITNRWAQVDDAFTKANAMLDNLPVDMAHLSELDFDARSTRIRECADTVELLIVPERWFLFKDDPAYYHDQWNSKMNPTPEDALGNVFNDSYVMPQLLRAISIYLLAISVFTPKDIANHKEDLGRFRTFLISRHDKSEGGIKTMSYAEFDAFNNERLWTGKLIFNIATNWDFGHKASAYYDGGIDYYQPFGAVHLFTGINSYDKFPPLPALGDPGLGTVNIKLALATRSRWKDVYVSVGLPEVWDCIDQLGRLIGEPPLDRDEGRWWRAREIHSILHKPLFIDRAPEFETLSDGTPLVTTAPISLMDTLTQLYKLYGMPTRDPFTNKQLPLSLRAVLDTATIRQKVPPEKLGDWWSPLFNAPLIVTIERRLQ
jgi:hypothetical protein